MQSDAQNTRAGALLKAIAGAVTAKSTNPCRRDRVRQMSKMRS